MKLIELEIPDVLLPFSEALCQSMEVFGKNRLNKRRDVLLKAYVDIILNDHSLKRFFQVSVTVPLLLDRLQARLYLYENRNDRFLCVCDSKNGLFEPPQSDDYLPPGEIRSLYEHGGWLYYPLYPRAGRTQGEIRAEYSKQRLYDPDPYFTGHSLLGLYAVSPAENISEMDRSFFEILVRWMGNKLNNRLITKQHLEHLQFLKTLGRDIGHNIIVPNMYLKHLLRQVEKQIDSLRAIEQEAETFTAHEISTKEYVSLLGRYRDNLDMLEQSHQELLKHHEQSSLFLESLLKEQHFSQGHLVVQLTSCFIERDIIIPQIDLYLKKFAEQQITVEKPDDLYEQKFPLLVDRGLLSQVYANLFSNAVKYTGEIVNHQGKRRKTMCYGAEEVLNFPEPGRGGIKFNVFTTGPRLSEDERKRIFEEGYRGASRQGITGSGHGLNFIRRVLELHGGVAGCEASEEGNNFFMILPVPIVTE